VQVGGQRRHSPSIGRLDHQVDRVEEKRIKLAIFCPERRQTA